jgi:hypothetical protein
MKILKRILSWLRSSEKGNPLGQIINTRTELSVFFKGILAKEAKYRDFQCYEQKISSEKDFKGINVNCATGLIVSFESWDQYRDTLETLLSNRKNLYLILYGSPYNMKGYLTNPSVKIPEGENIDWVSRNYFYTTETQREEILEILRVLEQRIANKSI